jgi:2-methylcitrate dehydratase PrpD
MKNITQKYIKQILNTNFKDFSEKTIEETKKAILDTMACMIAGVQSPVGKTAIKVLAELGGTEEATVIGYGKKLPAPIAAYITGQCCVGPDLSDNYQPESIIISHPGEAVIPAVLALGEKIDASLEDIFVAVILGYETVGRYAIAIEPRRPEVYSFSTHYTLGAAIGCIKLLKLNEEEAINALGIAGTLAPLPVTMPMWGFRERPASWHRDMPGHANFAAVMACLFAQTEFKGTHLLLEEDTKYYKIAGSDNYQPEVLFKNWGERYVVDAITYKTIPSCYFNQPCIEAVRLLMEENNLDINNVQKIELYAPTNLAKNFIYYPPKTSVDTASSVKYLTAMYIMTKKPGPDWYLNFDKYLKMDNYQNIAEKIQVLEDTELQKILEEQGKVLGKVKISTKEQEYEKTVEWVKGNPHKPYSLKDIENKFMLLSESVIGKEIAKNIVEKIKAFDRSENISNIFSGL